MIGGGRWFQFVPGGRELFYVEAVSTKAAARDYMWLYVMALRGLDPSGTHPPTPRRPDHKSLQAEATTCRKPRESGLPGGPFLWRSRRFSAAAQILPECVSC
jgi:hypothetical protein